jgi:hypothetical protein
VKEEIIETEIEKGIGIEKETKRDIATNIQMMRTAMTKKDIGTIGKEERSQVLY